MSYNYGFSPFVQQNNQQAHYRDQFRNASKYRNQGSNFKSYTAAPVKKHSGCSGGLDKNGKRYVQGWKFSKHSGLISFFAAPYKGTNRVTSQQGRNWENWICKILNKSTMQESIMPCLYDASTGKVILNKLGYVMNPKGGRGGYVGRFTMPRN